MIRQRKAFWSDPQSYAPPEAEPSGNTCRSRPPASAPPKHVLRRNVLRCNLRPALARSAPLQQIIREETHIGANPLPVDCGGRLMRRRLHAGQLRYSIPLGMKRQEVKMPIQHCNAKTTIHLAPGVMTFSNRLACRPKASLFYSKNLHAGKQPGPVCTHPPCNLQHRASQREYAFSCRSIGKSHLSMEYRSMRKLLVWSITLVLPILAQAQQSPAPAACNYWHLAPHAFCRRPPRQNSFTSPCSDGKTSAVTTKSGSPRRRQPLTRRAAHPAPQGIGGSPDAVAFTTSDAEALREYLGANGVKAPATVYKRTKWRHQLHGRQIVPLLSELELYVI